MDSATICLTIRSLVITAILLNCILIIHLIKTRKRWKNVQVLSFSLAISDVVFAAAVLIITSVECSFEDDFIDDFRGSVFATLLCFSSLVPSFHLQVLAVERFLAVHKPIWAKINMTKRRTAYIAVAVWGLVAVLSSTTILIKLNFEDYKTTSLVGLRLFASAILVQAAIIELSYGFIAWKLYNKWRRDCRSHCRKHIVAIIYCQMLAFSYLVSFLPFAIERTIHPKKLPIPATSAMILLSGLLNPILYLVKYLPEQCLAKARATSVKGRESTIATQRAKEGSHISEYDNTKAHQNCVLTDTC